MAQKIKAVVESKEKISTKVYSVVFKLIDPPELVFEAGQNILLLISENVNRTMSIASPPFEKNIILMAHDVSPMGPGSQWTLNLKVGDEVNLYGPTGGNLVLADNSKKKVFIATGTGIAPYRSMILEYLHAGGKSQIDLYWGMRYEDDLFWQKEFLDLENKYPNFKFNLVLSKPEPDYLGPTGHVTEHVLSEEKDPVNCDFYLCGNKPMIDQMKEKLTTLKVPLEQIKTELFY